MHLLEGTKNKNTIGISNNEIELLEKSINIFSELFGIDKRIWKVYVRSNKRKEFDNIRQKYKDLLGRTVGVNFAKLAEKECIEFRINSRILSCFIDIYFKEKIREIITTKDLAKQFIRGYAVGDGSIALRGKQVHHIAITIKNPEYVRYVVKAWELDYEKTPHIRLTKKCYEVYYSHVSMITKSILGRIFIDSKRQWIKLIKGYKNKIYTRSRIPYWKVIEERSFNALEIAQLTGMSHWAVRDALNTDIKKGLVSCSYERLNTTGAKTKYYYLSSTGQELLNLLKEVKDV